MQAFNQKLTDQIHASGAYRNRFFERCRAIERISPEAVRPYAQNWYFVTKHFALAALDYTHVLGTWLRNETGKPVEKELILRALLQSLQIISQDFGLGLEDLGNPVGSQGIHYVLFGDMVKRLGIYRQELDLHIIQDIELFEPETCALINEMKIHFQDPVRGAAVFRVVEGIAYNIVDSMLPLFLTIERDGVKLYTPEELTYITLHLEIERIHDEQS